MAAAYGLSCRWPWAAVRVLESTADNFHALDMLSHDAPLGYLNHYTSQSPSTVFRIARQRLGELKDADPELIAFCQKSVPADKGKPGDDIQQQVELLRLLEAPGQSAKDAGEPSLSGLAALVREIQFMQLLRQIQLEAGPLRILTTESRGLQIVACQVQLEPSPSRLSANATLDLFRPVFQKHPYADYLEAFHRKTAPAAAELEGRLFEMDATDRSAREHAITAMLYGLKPTPGRNEYSRKAVERASWVYSDSASQEYQKGISSHSSYDFDVISPHCPFEAVRELKRNGQPSERLAELEMAFLNDYTVQLALFNHYHNGQVETETARLVHRLIELAPNEAEPYVRLAQIRLGKNDRVGWRETLDQFLKTEDSGFQHAEFRIEIAYWLMSQGKWSEAKEYAYAGAKCGADWGFSAAILCAEALEDPNRAEEFARHRAERYLGSTILEWYCLCRRVGHKNYPQAEARAREVLEPLEKNNPLEFLPFRIAFHRLAHEPELALQYATQGFELTGDPAAAMDVILLAIEQGKPKVRDKLLKGLRDRFDDPELVAEDRLAGRIDIILLAKQFADYRAVGNEKKLSDAEFQKTIKFAPEWRRPMLNLWTGHFLLLHGDRDNALKYLRLAATSPQQTLSRTIAAAMLQDLKVPIGRIRHKE